MLLIRIIIMLISFHFVQFSRTRKLPRDVFICSAVVKQIDTSKREDLKILPKLARNNAANSLKLTRSQRKFVKFPPQKLTTYRLIDSGIVTALGRVLIFTCGQWGRVFLEIEGTRTTDEISRKRATDNEILILDKIMSCFILSVKNHLFGNVVQLFTNINSFEAAQSCWL